MYCEDPKLEITIFIKFACRTCLLYEGAVLVDVAVTFFFQLLDDLALLLGLLAISIYLMFQGLFLLLENLHKALLFLSGLGRFYHVLLDGIKHRIYTMNEYFYLVDEKVGIIFNNVSVTIISKVYLCKYSKHL